MKLNEASRNLQFAVKQNAAHRLTAVSRGEVEKEQKEQ
jgi:hypothetical protein